MSGIKKLKVLVTDRWLRTVILIKDYYTTPRVLGYSASPKGVAFGSRADSNGADKVRIPPV